MKPKATIQWTLAFLLLASCMQAQSIWNTAHLANVKHSIHEPFYATTYEILKAEADRLLDAQPLSVMMKEKTPASGDKHDYMSQARYYWPDPTKPNGLPYINRDGVSNPELNKLDRNRLGTTAGRITTLALVLQRRRAVCPESHRTYPRMVSEQRHPNEPQPGICTNDAGTQ